MAEKSWVPLSVAIIGASGVVVAAWIGASSSPGGYEEQPLQASSSSSASQGTRKVPSTGEPGANLPRSTPSANPIGTTFVRLTTSTQSSQTH